LLCLWFCSTLDLACSLQAEAFSDSSSRPTAAACEPMTAIVLYVTAGVDLAAGAALAVFCGVGALQLEMMQMVAAGRRQGPRLMQVSVTTSCDNFPHRISGARKAVGYMRRIAEGKRWLRNVCGTRGDVESPPDADDARRLTLARQVQRMGPAESAVRQLVFTLQ
jgi:hypothetical protein